MRSASEQPRLDHVLCVSPQGLHRMAYAEWGDPSNPRVLICVHGLTRTGRDFDVLAQRLAHSYRVVCPDIVGRGRSDWLTDPVGYAIPQYVADCVQLINRLNVPTVNWLGTSMGGLIGMTLAAASPTPIHRLLLNDVGPALDSAALARIGEYVGRSETFTSFEQGVAYMRRVSASFGALSPEQWESLARHVIVQRDGGWTLHYDPLIGAAFRSLSPAAWQAAENLLWQAWSRIEIPVCVFRGESSDLLSRATVERMVATGRSVSAQEISGCGHAPALMSDEQIALVEQWFNQE